MFALQRWGVFCWALAVLASGCASPKARLAALEAQRHALEAENKALAAKNAEVTRALSDAVDTQRRLEDELAAMQGDPGRQGAKLVSYDPVDGAEPRVLAPREDIAARLRALANEYPSLVYDPSEGVCRLDGDLYFDSGRTHLRPRSERILRELVELFQSRDGESLRLLVVGHTDDQQITKKPGRDVWSNNFELSSARANSVAEFLITSGVPGDRIAVMGRGPYQPLASNQSALQRKLNRRVDIVVAHREMPLVGWTKGGQLR